VSKPRSTTKQLRVRAGTRLRRQGLKNEAIFGIRTNLPPFKD
jgi:hypothetical protein